MAREYAAAREQAALVELDERSVLAATGPQRQKFLHGILSNVVEGLRPGEGRPAALMTGNGHLVALLRLQVTPDAVLLEMPEDRLESVERHLVHYRVAAPVRFATRPVAVFGLLGPQAGAVLARAGFELPDLGPESHVTRPLAGHDVRLARAGDLPGGGFALHAPRDAREGVRDALLAAGALPLGQAALDALRVEAGRPWYGPDVSEENLLHETGLLAEYHAAKGCYVGQEVVARLEARGGHVSKRLRGLRLAAPRPAGTPLVAAGRELGRLTTAAVSPRLGPIAMGYVHRDQAAPGSVLDAAGASASVCELPLA